MGYDRLKQDSEKNTINQVLRAGGTALALGAGAVLFHRQGGTRELSNLVGQSKRILASTAREMQGRNPLGGKPFTHDLRDAASSALRAERERAASPISARIDSAFVGGRALTQEYHRMENFSTANLRKVYQQQEVIPELLSEHAKGRGPDETVAIQRAIHEVANKVSTRGPEAVPFHETVDAKRITDEIRYGAGLLDEEAEGMLQHIAERIQTSNEVSADFLEKQYKNLLDAQKKQITDVDQLTKRLGRKGQGGFLENLLGDRPATFEEIMDGVRRGEIDASTIGVPGEKAGDFAHLVNRMQEQSSIDRQQDFLDLYYDRSIRMRDGELYSVKNLVDPIEKFNKGFGKTIFGKIFRTDSMLGGRKSPLVHQIHPGQGDPVLASLAQDTKDYQNLTLGKSYMRILDRTYEASQEGLRYLEGSEKYKMIHQGTRQRLLGIMFGDVEMRDQRQNALLRGLDIGQAGAPTLLGRIQSIFKKGQDDTWIRTAVKNLQSGAFETDYKKGVEGIKSIDYMFSQQTRAMDQKTRSALLGHLTSAEEDMARTLRIANESNQKMLDTLMGIVQDSGKTSHEIFHNPDLVSLVGRYRKDPQRALQMASTKKVGKVAESLDYFDLLRRELDKESFLIQSKKGAEQKMRLLSLIEDAGANQKTVEETKNLMHWGTFQDIAKPSHGLFMEDTPMAFYDTLKKVQDLTAPVDGNDLGSQYVGDFQSSLDRMIDRGSSMMETRVKSSAELFQPTRYNQYVHMQKAVTPMDLIKNLNDEQKWKAFGKQFVAGRETPQDITEATMVPYFFLNRMSDAMNHVGLGFSARSIGSTPEFVKNIALKRILPVYAGITYGSYANDMIREITGTSFTGALASTAANVDIANRRFMDASGLGNLYQTEKDLNPLLRYWTGDEYQDADERDEWYDDGYSAVRRSRWWNFGSLNELRGSDIDYFQPNYLRRAHSNYRDASLYDSTWQKWSRNPLPTPTAPLSTVAYLANPYWLEEKHSESRPYPMTGKLFSEETPWGALLNPTLGEIIKPQRMMHEDRLGRSMVDVKMLIEERNRATFDQAQQGTDGNMIRIQDGMVEAVGRTNLYRPTPSQQILTITPGGQMLGYDGQFPGIAGSGGGGLGGGTGGGTGTGGAPLVDQLPHISSIQGETELDFQSRMELRATHGSFLPSLIHQWIGDGGRPEPKEHIRGLNAAMQARGAVDHGENIVTPQSIFRSQARYSQNILHNKEALADLRNINRGGESLTDLLYSARYITGIYGYMGHVITPNRVENRLANANRMTSMSQRFWDESIGGAGGGPQEILRRFIPHRNRNVTHVNPLMNDMPDWMPLRFRTGDPYSQIQKGSMRLPGRGYESLYDLNPDMYGAYGAFDRFKILADVAPYTDEYRLWRDIASKTVEGEDLREEMQEIRQRVNEQSKKNDFYHYGFLGRGLDQQTAIVEEVLNNNYFTIVGSDETYRMAGINVGQGPDGENPLLEYLRPGAEVQMKIDQNPYYQRNEDRTDSINAAVYRDGMNINRQLLDAEFAERREGDQSAAATMGMHSDFEILRGKAYEAFAHLPIPIIQDKYMRIRTPLESYQRGHIYNTPFASWQNPIQSYIKPFMERTVASPMNVAVGTLALGAARQLEQRELLTNAAQKWVNRGATLMNPGATLGASLGYISRLQNTDWVRKGGDLGAAGMLAGFAYTRRDEPLYATISGAGLGAQAAKIFNSGAGQGKAAMVGGLIGLAYSSQQKSVLDKEDRRNFLAAPYIPKRIQDVWEKEEYYDRLRYQKYNTLFEKAARRARIFEGTDIRQILHEYEMGEQEREEKRMALMAEKEHLEEIYGGGADNRRHHLLEQVDDAIAVLEDGSAMYLQGGKYTKSAILYKGAMDSTMYGLKENAGWAEILRALPRNDRDYFLEFAKEKDPEKREEILNYISPYSRRVLQIAWGEEPDRVRSNANYFNEHRLPGPTWSGWRPHVDIDDIMIKDIYNEGQMLSDYGYYESQLREPEAIGAPVHQIDSSGGALNLRNNLLTALNNAGITTASVDVTPTQEGGIQMLVNNARIEHYNARQRLPKILQRIF